MGTLSRRNLLLLAAAAPLVVTKGVHSAAPLGESGFVRIGGIDQWIAVQGEGADNPVILYLHGGPGEAQSPFLAQFRPWLKDFTVVNWDQRGAGKTYGRTGAATPDMTVERMMADAIEVAEHIRTRRAVRKIILVGQSWGSFLGVHVVKRRPDLFYAFVGTGQLVSLAASRPYQLERARRDAATANDQDSLKALDDAAALPAESRDLALAKALNKWMVPPVDAGYAKLVRAFMGAAPGDRDAADWLAGAERAGAQLMPTFRGGDLRALGVDFQLPFFVVHGREDRITPIEPAQTYLEELQAPAKAFVPIDGGHYACFTNADDFVGALRERVRPFAR
jgi:pimeloyl-ACP methyl ester carboxylesterase